MLRAVVGRPAALDRSMQRMGSPASPRRAAGDEQGFSRNPERWWSGAGQRVVVDCNDQRSGAKRSNSFPFPAHAPAERVEVPV